MTVDWNEQFSGTLLTKSMCDSVMDISIMHINLIYVMEFSMNSIPLQTSPSWYF
jgi:hypothetical protein